MSYDLKTHGDKCILQSAMGFWIIGFVEEMLHVVMLQDRNQLMMSSLGAYYVK